MALDVPNRLKELRDERGWTQRELADRAGLTDQTISNLERGTRPSLDTALAVARAFGLPVEGVFLPAASTTDVESIADEVAEASATATAPSGGITASDRTAAEGPVAHSDDQAEDVA